MRNACMLLSAAVLACACASAQQPVAKAIPDAEPEVTAQVAALLGSVASNALAPEALTDNLRAALPEARVKDMGAALRRCGNAPALELLQRTTKGEDRQYVYRAPCGGSPLLIAVDFNKGARVNRLEVRPE